MDQSSMRLYISDSEVVFNNDSQDTDFRVESDSNANMLFVDGGNNSVGIGTGNPVASGQSTITIGTRTIVGKTVENQSLFSDNAYYTGSMWTTKETDSWASIRTNNNSIRFHTGGTHTAGTSLTAMDQSSMRLYISDSEVVFNNDSQDTNFRVESDSNDHMLFVDAGQNRVYVGGSTNVENAALNVQGSKTFSVDIPQNLLTVTDTTAMAAGVGGAITFAGRYHTNGSYTAFGSIEGVKTLSNNGNYDGRIIIKSRDHAGYNRQRLTMNSGEAVFNEDGVDTDFRVESSNNSDMLVVEAAGDQVRMGNASASTPSSVASLVARNGVTTDYSGSLTMSYQAGTYTDYYKGMTGINLSTASGRGLHIFNYDNDSDGGVNIWSGRPTVGTPIPLASFNGSSGTVFNPDRGGVIDFRVASGSNNHALFVDSGQDSINIGTSSTNPPNGARFRAINHDTYLEINHASGSSSGAVFMDFRYSQANIGKITQNGTSQVLYVTTSDSRLKENIADADDAGSKIDAIQVRKYDWKVDGSHQKYGMIAQELLEVAPEAVSVSEDPDEMMGVDYSKLVPMLIKEIQSLRLRVADLES